FACSGFGQRDGLAEQLSRNRQIVLQCVFASGLLEACLDFGPVDRWTFAPAEQSQLKELADLHVVFAAKVMTDLRVRDVLRGRGRGAWKQNVPAAERGWARRVPERCERDHRGIR